MRPDWGHPGPSCAVQKLCGSVCAPDSSGRLVCVVCVRARVVSVVVGGWSVCGWRLPACEAGWLGSPSSCYFFKSFSTPASPASSTTASPASQPGQSGSTHPHTQRAPAPTHHTPICHCCLEHKRSRAFSPLRSWTPGAPNLGNQLLICK